ncbi:MAG: RagB/SusD family nutrient uptake outer membrane protein, partial [Bacteroidota bacterium]
GCGDDVVRTVSMSPASDQGRLVNFNFTARNTWIFNRWQINYEGIFRANWVISKAQELPSSQINILDEDQFLPIIVGEAKFLRALFYFNLVKAYGGVPIKPERIVVEGNSDNTIQPRSTREEVYDYIERDLREALIMVNDRFNGDNFQEGKIDKGAVATLLLKVLAYQAEAGVRHVKCEQARFVAAYLVERTRPTLREVLNFEQNYENEINPETWAEVKARLSLRFDTDSTLSEEAVREQELGQLLESARLYDASFPYESMWTDRGEFHSGSIFEVAHLELRETAYSVGTSWDNELGRNGSAGVLQPNNYWRDAVLNDPRAAYIFAQGGAPTQEYLCGEQEGSLSGVQPDPVKSYALKWFQPSCERPTSGSSNSGRNYRLFRYAEVLLFYAEALNELGDRAGSLAQLIPLLERANRIDSRFSDGIRRNIDGIQVDSYENVRDLIWQERRYELAFEFDRFWDIVRQGRAQEFMRAYNSGAAGFGPLWQKNFVAGINEIFPIPQQEIDISNGVVTQNP